MEDQAGLLPVHVAASAGQANMVVYLAARAGVEVANRQGLSPLMCAANRWVGLKCSESLSDSQRSENSMSLRMLVGLGADPLHTDNAQVGSGNKQEVIIAAYFSREIMLFIGQSWGVVLPWQAGF